MAPRGSWVDYAVFGPGCEPVLPRVTHRRLAAIGAARCEASRRIAAAMTDGQKVPDGKLPGRTWSSFWDRPPTPNSGCHFVVYGSSAQNPGSKQGPQTVQVYRVPGRCEAAHELDMQQPRVGKQSESGVALEARTTLPGPLWHARLLKAHCFLQRQTG